MSYTVHQSVLAATLFIFYTEYVQHTVTVLVAQHTITIVTLVKHEKIDLRRENTLWLAATVCAMRWSLHSQCGVLYSFWKEVYLFCYTCAEHWALKREHSLQWKRPHNIDWRLPTDWMLCSYQLFLVALIMHSFIQYRIIWHWAHHSLVQWMQNAKQSLL